MDDDELALVSNRCSNHDRRPAMTTIQGDIAPPGRRVASRVVGCHRQKGTREARQLDITNGTWPLTSTFARGKTSQS